MKAGLENEALNVVKIRDKMTAERAKSSCTSSVKIQLSVKKAVIHRNLVATLVMKDRHPLVGPKLPKGNC